jgi:adenine C2-methylase RlmN of 23S rRNA A2503 and tRNA A37
MKYTIKELKHLRNIRLKAFKQTDFMDDSYTNDFQDFKHNTDLFLKWLEKMEANNKINELLSTMSEPCPQHSHNPLTPNT